MADIDLTYPTILDKGNFSVTKEGILYATKINFDGTAAQPGTLGNFKVYSEFQTLTNRTTFHLIIPDENNRIVLSLSNYEFRIKNYGINTEGILYCSQVYVQSANTSSDRSLKNTIRSLISNQEFDKTNPIIYKYNNDNSLYHIGFIADEIQDIFGKESSLVMAREKDNDDTLYLNYEELIALNTLEIQELQKREKELEDFIQKYIELQGE